MQPIFREYLAECMEVFSMCVLGRHHWRKFPFYTVFQLIGSFMRAVTIYTLYYVTGPTATAQIFATYPADYVPQHLDRFGRPGDRDRHSSGVFVGPGGPEEQCGPCPPGAPDGGAGCVYHRPVHGW